MKAMRKVDFDLAAGAIPGAPASDIHSAARVMERNRRLLQAPGVVGIWVGARASKPYIILAVSQDRGDELRDAIPDSLDGVNVYYIEGALGN
jgi:hypothetical protein